MRTVGQVAALTGVSVRTLHHYDKIGLVTPSERSEAGYRLYGRADLERLQEVLGWRGLGLPLHEIGALLDDPAHDRGDALRRQRELVGREVDRLAAVAGAIDRALAAHHGNANQEEASMFEGFDPTEYEDEARERWGETDAYRESARRTAAYGESEWRQIRAESEAIVEEFAVLLAAGEPADGAAAGAVAERHRRHIAEWFYDCSPAFHRGLAEMYVADPRFAASYEKVAPGLARYVHDAIVAGAADRPAAP